MDCPAQINRHSVIRFRHPRTAALIAMLLWFIEPTTGLSQSPLENTQTGSEARFFEVDNDHSSLIFAVSHAGLSYTYGRFEKCSGQIFLGEDPTDSNFRFKIDVASINTNNILRDEHLQGSEFFDVKNFPKINFTSTGVTRNALSGPYIVTGTMAMHGVERKIEMPVTLIGVGKGPMGKTRGGFMTKFVLQRSDFGIDAMPKIIGDQIAVTFSFEGILGDAPAEVLPQTTPLNEN